MCGGLRDDWSEVVSCEERLIARVQVPQVTPNQGEQEARTLSEMYELRAGDSDLERVRRIRLFGLSRRVWKMTEQVGWRG